MYQYEKIASYIERYLDQCMGDGEEIVLSALQIRKMPEVAALCQNTNAPSVCNAMEHVKRYSWKYVGGKKQSTTYKLSYCVKK